MTFTAIRPDLGLSKGREVSLYLASKGLLHKPALYLSDYFERNKAAYVDHLMAVRQGNHLREWLVFFLFGVEETARASASVFRSVLSLKQRIEQDVLPRFSARRQVNAQALMRQLYARPVIDVKGVAGMPGMTGASINTAAALIADMVSFGVLHEITGQRRNRLFLFRDYLDLFRRQP
jgi:Fic family protein